MENSIIGGEGGPQGSFFTFIITVEVLELNLKITVNIFKCQIIDF